MSSIVRSNYPAARLPDDLRDGLDPSATVTVTVTVEEQPEKIMSLDEIWALRRPPYRTKAESTQKSGANETSGMNKHRPHPSYIWSIFRSDCGPANVCREHFSFSVTLRRSPGLFRPGEPRRATAPALPHAGAVVLGPPSFEARAGQTQVAMSVV